MKVIFLDIDGVMNYAGTDAKAPSGVLGIVDNNVKALRKLIDITGAKVVLTSTWKKDWNKFDECSSEDGKYLSRKFNRHGIHILDKTNDNIVDRGAGIERWLKSNDHVTDWVVIDDDIFADYGPHGIMKHFVKVKYGEKGFDESYIDQCVKILSGELNDD